MTTTLDRPETAAEVTPASFVWAPDWALLADLASVSACASSDRSRPLLEGIHLYRDGADMVAEATDSYALCQVRVEVAGDADLDLVISSKWIRDVLKATKPRAKQRADVLLTIRGDEVTASSGGVTMSTLAVQGTYPSTGHLIPAEGNYCAELGAFNPVFLARMADVLPTPKSTATWSCVSMSATRPSLWRSTAHRDGTRSDHGYTARGLFLLMPVRIN